MEQLIHQRLHIGQRFQAVSDIPRRQHTQLLTQHAGAAAVVRYRNDSRQIIGMALQAPQHGAQPCAAADGHDPWPLSAGAAINILFCHSSSVCHIRVISRWFSVTR